MGKRVMHMIKDEITLGVPKVYNGITHTRVNRIFWCGKIDRILTEDPLVLTPVEQAEHDLAVAKIKANPWPLCQRCRKAKDKSLGDNL